MKNIALRSEAGANYTVIRMVQESAAPFVRESVVMFQHGETDASLLEGFWLTGGAGTDMGLGWYCAGGVFCWDSSPSVRSCIISGNALRIGDGGGIFCSGSPTFTDCTIEGNAATNGGGVACHDSPTFVRCTIAGNSADGTDGAYGGGGGVFSWDFVTLSHCVVWGNAGGSIRLHQGSAALVTFSCIEDADVWPGEGNIKQDPMFCAWDSSRVSVSSSREFREALRLDLGLSDRSPCLGAGEDGSDIDADTGRCGNPGARQRRIQIAAGTYEVRGHTLAHGVSLEGTGPEETTLLGAVAGLRTGAVLSGVTVTGAQTSSGAVSVGAEAPEMRDVTIRRSPWVGLGCGAGAAPLITGCKILENGESVKCQENSRPTLINCTVSATDPLVFEGSHVTLEKCSIDSIWTGRPWYDGALVFRGSSATLSNCSITGSFAGIDCRGSEIAMTNCTVADNAGHGLSLDAASCAVMTNSVLWWNGDSAIFVSEEDPADRCREATPTVNASCVEGAPWPGVGSISDDPRFRRRGVFDFTRFESVEMLSYEIRIPRFVTEPGDYRLRRGSPCIDTGTTEGAPDADLEGNGRPCGDGIDMGAHEACSLEPLLRRGDCNDDGAVDISDAIFSLGSLFLGDGDPGCDDACDSNDDGVMDLSDAVYTLTWAFLGGPPPANAFPLCAPDPTDDSLTCESFQGCD